MLKNIALVMAVIVCLLGGCSVLDAEDRADLDAAINKMPKPDRFTMAGMAATSKTRKWLRGHAPNTRVMGVECSKQLFAGDSWTEPSIEQDLVVLVSDLVTCMNGVGLSYNTCIETLSQGLVAKAEQRWADKIAASPGTIDKGIKVSCSEIIEPEFIASTVPGADEDLERMAADEIVDWLLGQPVMPAGFSPATWEPLLPLLCALGSGWGCTAASNPLLNGTITTPSSGVGATTGGDP